MFTRELTIISVPVILLLLNVTTACQATAPPDLPGGVANPPVQDDLDTVNSLPESQQPVQTSTSSPQDSDNNDDDNGSSPETQQLSQGDDTQDQDDDDDESALNDDDDDEESDDDDEESLLENQQHPVANALVQEFNVDYEEIVALVQAGYGYGEIAKAYSLSDELGMTPQEILPLASEMGWGELLKAHGLHPSLAGKGNNLGATMSKQKGKGNPPAHAGPPGGDGPPGQIKKDK